MDESFLLALSEPEPIPGGGAAAAYGACVGLALLEKIIRVELRRRQISPELICLWEDLLAQVRLVNKDLHRLRNEDGRAYMCLAAAKKSEKGESAVTTALVLAISCPAEIMEKACEALNFVSEAGEYCKRHLTSDLLVSGELIMAAVRGSYQIARANLRLMSDLSLKNAFKERLEQLQSRCQDSFRMLHQQILARTSRAHLDL